MRFIYATDIHGNIERLNMLLEQAMEHNVKILHLGADFLPKGSDLLGIQKSFLKKEFKAFYLRCQEQGITVLVFFGNDDLYTRKKYFKAYGSLLDETPVTIEDYTFRAYSYICDYPFPLKTACKLDTRDSDRCPCWKYVTVSEKGMEEIPDIDRYFADRTTIEEDLRDLTADDKTIMAMHMPPAYIGLDECYGHRQVGSKAIYDWINRIQPLLVLCGHIHESPEMTGKWRENIGKTTVIQPGDHRSILIDIGEYVGAEEIR